MAAVLCPLYSPGGSTVLSRGLRVLIASWFDMITEWYRERKRLGISEYWPRLSRWRWWTSTWWSVSGNYL